MSKKVKKWLQGLILLLSFCLLFQNPALSDQSHYPNGEPNRARTFATELLYTDPSKPILGGFAVADLYIDPSFSQEQKDIIKQAYPIAQNRFMSSVACAEKNSIKDKYPSDKAFILTNFRKTPVRISRIWDMSNVVGLGYINILSPGAVFGATGISISSGFTDSITIALNSDYIGKDSWVGFSSPDYWAGVIAHEMLHNLGLDHPTGYEGSYIDVYGDCVWYNGILAGRAFSLVDDPNNPDVEPRDIQK